MELQEFKDKITVGQVLNNMELVELLGTEAQKESYKKNNKLYANTKKALLRELESLCSYKEIKVKNKVNYVISEIFTAQKNIKDKRKNNKGKNKGYEDLIKTILLNLLEEHNNKLTISNTSLMQKMGMVNNNYVNRSLNLKNRLKKADIKHSNYLVFNSIMQKSFKKILDRSLKSLDDKSVVEFEKRYLVNIELLEEKKENKIKILEIPRYLHKLIRETQHLELQNYKEFEDQDITLSYIFLKNKQYEFYNDVLEKIEDDLREFIKLEIGTNEFIINGYFRVMYIETSSKSLEIEKNMKYYKESIKKLNGLSKEYMLNNTKNNKTYNTKLKQLNAIAPPETFNTENTIIDSYNKDAVELIQLFIAWNNDK